MAIAARACTRAEVMPLATPPRPQLQAKLRVGAVSDPLEHEADRVADAVIAGRLVGTVSHAAAGLSQRKCAACEAEEEKNIRRKSVGSGESSRAEQLASGAGSAVAAGGMPLSPSGRAYFEPRFGRDLSDIRIHTHEKAARAASGINARAYTLGRDIAFAPGEFQPQTDSGRHLMAHELAHVMQQEEGATPAIRRASYGSGTPPNWATRTLGVAPQDERARVDEALAIIDEIAAGPGSFSECHDHFAEHCPSGNSGTLASVWQQATIWRITTPGASENARGDVNGTNIAYTANGYDQGAEGLAGSLLHEAGHNCGIPGGDTHWRAAQIRSYCIGPGRNSISFMGGGYLGGEAPALFLSYRRFLGDFASGRLRLTLGADVNLIGAGAAIGEAAGGVPESSRTPVEFGSAMVGAQVRLGGWGGSRYGGFSLRFETGVGAGQFALRPATPDEAPGTVLSPSWILQVGPRAEFLIRSGDAHVFPFTVSAALRIVEPTNSEARALQGFMGSVEFPF